MKFSVTGFNALQNFRQQLQSLKGEVANSPKSFVVKILPEFIKNHEKVKQRREDLNKQKLPEEIVENLVKIEAVSLYDRYFTFSQNQMKTTDLFFTKYIQDPIDASIELIDLLIGLHEKNDLLKLNSDATQSVVNLLMQRIDPVQGYLPNIVDDHTQKLAEIYYSYLENFLLDTENSKTNKSVTENIKNHLNFGNFIKRGVAEIAFFFNNPENFITTTANDLQTSIDKYNVDRENFDSFIRTVDIPESSTHEKPIDIIEEYQEKKIADEESTSSSQDTSEENYTAILAVSTEKIYDTFAQAGAVSEASNQEKPISISGNSSQEKIVETETTEEENGREQPVAEKSLQKENETVSSNNDLIQSADTNPSSMYSWLQRPFSMGWSLARGSWNLTANTLSYITSPVTSRLFSVSSSSTDTAIEQQSAEPEIALSGSTKTMLAGLQSEQYQKQEGKGKEKDHDDTPDNIETEQQRLVTVSLLGNVESVAQTVDSQQSDENNLIIQEESEPVSEISVAQDENASSSIVQQQSSNPKQNLENLPNQLNNNNRSFASRNQAIELFAEEKKWENLYDIWRTDTERFLEARSNKTKDIDHVLETAVASPDSNQKIKDVYNSTSRWLTKEENRPLLQSSRTNKVFQLRETMEVWYVLSNPEKSEAIKTALENIKGYLDYKNHDSTGTKKMWKLFENYQPGVDKKEDLARFIKIRDIANERLDDSGLTFFSSLTRSKETQKFYEYISNSNLILEQSSNAKHKVHDGYTLDDLNEYLAKENQPASSAVNRM